MAINGGTPDQALGAAITFYAKFPNEVDLFWTREEDDALHKQHFESESAEVFKRLLSRIDNVCSAIRVDARVIIDQFATKIEAAKWVSESGVLKPLQRRRTKGDSANWECQFKVFKKGAHRSRRAPIWIGLSLTNQQGHLVAQSWIWVRGGSDAAIREQIRLHSPRLKGLPENSGMPHTDTLFLVRESLLGSAQTAESIDSLLNRLCLPFKHISATSWTALIDSAKK